MLFFMLGLVFQVLSQETCWVPGSRYRMGAFGKGYSGSRYRVDKVCDTANSADHNQSNAAYCYRRRGMVRVSVFACM